MISIMISYCYIECNVLDEKHGVLVAKLLLLQTVIHIFKQLANEIECITGSTSKSLEYVINELKFK